MDELLSKARRLAFIDAMLAAVYQFTVPITGNDPQIDEIDREVNAGLLARRRAVIDTMKPAEVEALKLLGPKDLRVLIEGADADPGDGDVLFARIQLMKGVLEILDERYAHLVRGDRKDSVPVPF